METHSSCVYTRKYAITFAVYAYTTYLQACEPTIKQAENKKKNKVIYRITSHQIRVKILWYENYISIKLSNINVQ